MLVKYDLLCLLEPEFSPMSYALLQEAYPSSKLEDKLNEQCLKKAGRQYCWIMEIRDVLMHLMCMVYVEKIELEINQNMGHETYVGRGHD